MAGGAEAQRFEVLFRPHLAAAYNLARHLTGQDGLAQDVVQESCIRAFRFLDRFEGGNARAWLLAIVRNQAYTLLAAQGRRRDELALGDEIPVDAVELADHATPERLAMGRQERAKIRSAIAALPADAREMVVLRDLEDMSYKEIAEVTGLPIGTVMSRLARARARLKASILGEER